MSRSKRAWLESCAPASVGERTGLEEQASLGRGPLLGAVSSTRRLVKFLAASMLLVAFAPASALASSVSGQHASVTQKKPQSTHTRAGLVVLASGSGYFGRNGAAQVRVLQRRLARAGDSPGPIDGRYGLRTEQAVTRFQAGHGLQADGVAGPLTLAALSRPSQVVLYPGAGYGGHGSRAVRALQRRLASAGYASGPIDGRYGPRTEQAVTRFQAAHGLQADGIAGPRTLAHLGNQQQLTPHQATRPSRPASSHHQANRRSPQGRSGPHTAPRQPARASASRKVLPATRASSPLVGLLALLIALAVVLWLAVAWLARRRRTKRYADADVAANLASRSDPAEAIAAYPNNPTTTPKRTTTADSGEFDDADRAFRHALLLEEHGDQIGAMAAYQRADQLGHGAAACNLGVLLEGHGDLAAAEAAYRRADQRGDANAAFNLAVLLEERDELAEAIEAYRRADQLGHGAAASNLGVLLEGHGDLAAAEAAYRRADQRGDANGAFNLAVLLEERGDQLGALRAYQRADQLGHPAIAEMARAAAHDLTRQISSAPAAGNGGGHDGS